MRRNLILLALSIFLSNTFAERAAAVPAFKKVFEKTYITDETDKDFAKIIKSSKTGCFVCHQGKKKKNLNRYGTPLGKLLDKKKDIKDKEKIAAALKKVDGMHSDSDDKQSPTFGELIKDNKLPGGPLEEVKKEPKEKEEGDDHHDDDDDDDEGDDEDDDDDDD